MIHADICVRMRKVPADALLLFLFIIIFADALLMYAALKASSVCGLKLVVHAALSYLYMRPSATRYAAFSY